MNESPITVPVSRGPLMTAFIPNQGYRSSRRNYLTRCYLRVQNELESSDLANLRRPLRRLDGRPTRPLDGRMGTSDEQRENNARVSARTANRLILPKNFPADKDELFAILINLCLNEAIATANRQNKKRDKKRVSSLELYQCIQRNKKNLNHVASRFSEYSEDDLRLFPKSWLSLDIPVDALAKCMCNYASEHSEQHMQFLKEIGFTYQNMVGWMLDVLKKRCSLNIQSFERNTDNGFTVSYQIPVTPIKTNNIFNANLLSIKIVIAYNLKNFDTYHKRGKLVTVYLQNTKLQSYEKDGILKKSPNAIQRNSTQFNAIQRNSLGRRS